jgi:hypothetical protein
MNSKHLLASRVRQLADAWPRRHATVIATSWQLPMVSFHLPQILAFGSDERVADRRHLRAKNSHTDSHR